MCSSVHHLFIYIYRFAFALISWRTSQIKCWIHKQELRFYRCKGGNFLLLCFRILSIYSLYFDVQQTISQLIRSFPLLYSTFYNFWFRSLWHILIKGQWLNCSNKHAHYQSDVSESGEPKETKQIKCIFGLLKVKLLTMELIYFDLS